MEGIREYLISVTAAALLCGILKNLTGGKGSIYGLLQLICGIFVILTVIRPLKDFSFRDFDLLPANLMEEAKAVSHEGVDYARQATARLIKEQCEAYILDKAQALGADVRIDIRVSVDSNPIPVSSVISGDLSPYARNQLGHVLEKDLGIAKEDQQWIN